MDNDQETETWWLKWLTETSKIQWQELRYNKEEGKTEPLLTNLGTTDCRVLNLETYTAKRKLGRI